MLELPAEPESPAAARRFVQRELAGHCDPAAIEAAVLLTSELATNVVKHAGTPMRLDLRWGQGRVRVEISDDSHAMPHRVRTMDDYAPSGRGLVLVERLARSWGADERPMGKVVWFEVDALIPAGGRRARGRRSAHPVG
jgi:anti-sigma regulatory factor (Ser/Thr protein kinase)